MTPPPPPRPLPSLPDAESSRLKHFWTAWRRDIFRGAMLFTAVVAVGLTARRVTSSASRSFHDVVRGGIPFGDWDVDFDAPGRQSGDEWRWRGSLREGQRVWLRNTNGPISVEGSPGDIVEVTGEKSWAASDPSVVRFEAVPSANGVTICALWDSEHTECRMDGGYRMNRTRRNDVAVRFTVRLPRGVRVDASTVNGPVVVAGASAGVSAATINGKINVATTSGPVHATTVNGSVDAAIGALGGQGAELQTVNGSVTAVLPARLNAELDAETVAGRVEADFPLSITGRMSPRHVRARIGSGGPTIKLRTVTGSIEVRRSGQAAWSGKPAIAPRPAKAPAPTPPPDAPRQPR